MIEIHGNLWNYFNKPNTRICLTVNGTIKVNGCAVLGRGCALEGTKHFPDLGRVWGERLKQYGLKVMYLHEFDIFMFPVKYNWWEPANLGLITKSSEELGEVAMIEPHTNFILPRPGCGNGRRTWDEIKPIVDKLPDNVKVISW